MTEKDIYNTIDAAFVSKTAETNEETENKPVIDLSNKGIAKLIMTGLVSSGIRRATSSAMKTFGYAPDLFGEKGQPSVLTKVEIGLASVYVSRIFVNKTTKMIDSDLDKLADLFVEFRDTFNNKESN